MGPMFTGMISRPSAIPPVSLASPGLPRIPVIFPAEGGRIGFLAGQRHLGAHVAGQPYHIAVSKPDAGAGPDPVAVDEGPVRGVLVADSRMARIIDGDRRVPSRYVLVAGKGRRYQGIL